ncbi:hypothetical protein F511_45609 [Dorcoceras hygrometricum]|uniref:Uncharacterized protein n=1 Tax=Dorcoceras hygrometricum TaxID=472368 RepID=A0A2Z6ZVL1_9LAMI|nr:hypothetical protein F511_45609 [Dorcoceras hygrometricum]
MMTSLLMSSTLSAPADLYRSSSNLRLISASVPAGPFAPADLSSFAENDVVTDYIIIDGPLRCSSWFSFDVPADPSSSSSACSWFLSYQLIHYPPADCGRNRQSGLRPETRLLRQPTLEGLTRSARTDSPRRIGQKQFSGEDGRQRTAGGGGGLREERGGGV